MNFQLLIHQVLDSVELNEKTPHRNHKLKLSVPRVCPELFFYNHWGRN